MGALMVNSFRPGEGPSTGLMPCRLSTWSSLLPAKLEKLTADCRWLILRRHVIIERKVQR